MANNTRVAFVAFCCPRLGLKAQTEVRRKPSPTDVRIPLQGLMVLGTRPMSPANKMSKRKVVIVDAQDREIGFKYRNEIKSGTDIYRCIGIWITNKQGDILIAQRSFSKSHDPGKWGPAVAGTVEEGETYESNARKELQEELGLKGVDLIVGPKYFQGKFFGQLFFAELDKNASFTLQEEEVEQVKWISRRALVQDVKNNPESYVPSMGNIIDLV